MCCRVDTRADVWTHGQADRQMDSWFQYPHPPLTLLWGIKMWHIYGTYCISPSIFFFLAACKQPIQLVALCQWHKKQMWGKYTGAAGHMGLHFQHMIIKHGSSIYLIQFPYTKMFHCNDVITGAMASHITSITIVYSSFYSDADQRKHQRSTSLAFVRGIHWGPVNSPHKWSVTRKMFPFDDVIMHNSLPRGWAIGCLSYINSLAPGIS